MTDHSSLFRVSWTIGTLLAATFLFALFHSVALGQSPSALRKSPDFTIAEPSGRVTQLSSFKGRVVVLEFLFLNSPHCLRVARTLNTLQSDLGRRGFQSVAVVFGPNADEQRVSSLMNYLKLSYPVGYTTSSSVDTYLGRSGNEVLSIPQLVVIDRTGLIRATTGTKRGEIPLEDETYLRGLINNLLADDPHATAGSDRRPASSASPSKLPF